MSSILSKLINLAGNITGTLAVANGGTGVTTSTGTTNVVLSNSPTLVTPVLGTPSSGTLTSCTGLPITTGTTGLSQYNVPIGDSSNATQILATNLLGNVSGSYLSQSYTVTNASPGVFTVTTAPATGTKAYVTATQNGYTANTTYYVYNVSGTTFQLCTTLANAYTGTGINSSGSTGGTIISGGFAAPIVTTWTSFTPTGSWSTNTTYTGYWRRVGQNLEMNVQVACSGAPTSAALTINIPFSLTIDTSSIVGDGNRFALMGVASTLKNGTDNWAGLTTFADGGSTSAFAIAYPRVNGSQIDYAPVTQAVPITFANGDKVVTTITLPISGWTATT